MLLTKTRISKIVPMNLTKIIKFSSFISISFTLIFLNACNTEIKSKSYKTKVELPNGKLLEVVKTNSTKEYYGILTNHHYTTDYTYNYKFTVNNDDVFWDGLSSVPKKILFAQGVIYAYSLKENFVPRAIDSIHKNKESLKIEKDSILIERVYEKFKDERYFFKQFGKASWITIKLEEYEKIKKMGQEFDIPNDNELKEK